ncbi:uncharacterized protein EV420DRAFT_1481168 [Desarmillaria tabescens]|uniref:Uncharacterized protein n=1 Tax=Armillaria tabescens TaxID=1929756 RepID=A0AA39KBF4_ARMTA|nr:uncharacterized protein EV420DRAFT_1481168 [Desarmillaria tabescens]KAK0455728.1 hypothetical protein EV420DRAFT_1481168 [Desarmillaria tabescens]
MPTASNLKRPKTSIIKFTLNMEGRHVLFEADAWLNVEAIQLCSSVIIMHCLELKQQAEVLYSVALQASMSLRQLDLMKQKLWLQGTKIEGLMRFYREYKISLMVNSAGV